MTTSSDVATWRDLAGDLQQLCASLDPSTVSPDAIGALFEVLATIRRSADGALTRLAPRYERTGVWKDKGEKSAADAVAKATGTTPADSKRRLDTGKRLGGQPQLDDAIRNGAVSTEQAEVISGAADSDDATRRLIETARTGSHRQLRDEAARERAKSDRDEEARLQRQRKLRSVRRWTDSDGMYNLLLRTLPEHGAEIDARLKPLTDGEFDRARKEGRRESVDAYAADVVVDVLRGATTDDAPGRRSRQAVRPERKVIALVDIEALNRGSAEGDETCELAGVGPVSVAAVRALFGDAAMTAVFKDAEDIRSVVHLGRQVTAKQRTALEARGARCGIVGCGSSHHLEIDHTTGWTYTLETNVDDLEWLCSTDHAIKTWRNLLAIGPPGRRVLVERDPADPTRPKLPQVQVRPVPVDAEGGSGSIAVGGARGDPTESARPPSAPTQAAFDLAT